MRQKISIALAVLVVGASASIGMIADDASAFEPGPAQPITAAPAVGTTGGVLGTGVLVVGPGALAAPVGALSAGSVVGLGVAAAATGYALGYYGASATCQSEIGGMIMDDYVRPVASFFAGEGDGGELCNPYQFSNVLPSGMVAGANPTLSAEYQASIEAQYGPQPYDYQIMEASWDTRADFGAGDIMFGAVLVSEGEAFQRVNSVHQGSGGYQSPSILGCGANYYLQQNSLNTGNWYKGVGAANICGPGQVDRTTTPADWNSGVSSPPYTDGFVRWETYASDLDVWGNVIYRPGDRMAIVRVTGGSTQVNFDNPETEPVYGWAPANPIVDQRGVVTRFRSRADCEDPGGTITSRTSTGAWGFEVDMPSAPPLPCVETELPRQFELYQDVQGRRYYQTGEILTETVVEWELPPELQTAPAKDCFRVGRTSDCVATATVGEDGQPESACEFGGVSLALAACIQSQPTTDPWPQGEPQPDPEPASSTTTTSTVTAPTTTPPDENCVGVQCIETPPAGDLGDAGCWSNGWSWNPISWVLIPIKCALLWAFWDADAWAVFWGDVKDYFGPWLDWIGSFADVISAGVPDTACVPLEEPVCAGDVINVELPAAIPFLIGAVFLLGASFDVLGFFSRMTGG